MKAKRIQLALTFTAVIMVACVVFFDGGGNIQSAMAQTILFETGWEAGEERGLSNQVAYSHNVAGYFNSSDPPPESGARFNETVRSGSYSLLLAGYSRASYAYCYYRLFDEDIAISKSTKIGYWIYHQEGTAKIAVDGHFTDGSNIRDFGGGVLTDQHGVRIHPGLRVDPMNQWVYVEVDLSAAAGKTLDFILFAYDNGGDGFTGPYRTYVDDFQVFEGAADSCLASVAADRWQGEYYSNMNLSGSPVLVRDDGAGFLNFDWGTGSPGSDCGVPSDQFSVRWMRDVYFNDGTYRFTITSDDGFRLFIDDTLQIERWVNQAPTTYTVDVSLAAGYHTLELEYYENGGGAVARLSWDATSNSCITGVAPGNWQGEYFDNLDVSGNPVLVRDDGNGDLNFDWGTGSPDSSCGIGVDRFSVRWSRDINFSGGTYRFTVTGDDGVRLYVDKALKLERWIDQAPTTYTVDVWLSEGHHEIQLEYYENGGGAVAKLTWQKLQDACNTGVPADHWQGEYFDNPDLSGSPNMVRDDGSGSLNFDWGSGSPGSNCGIGADGFSVRWRRNVYFNSGNYRFTVTDDDGFKLYVDGALKLSRWFDQAPTTYTVDVNLVAGNHTVQLEYYENGGGAVAKLSWGSVSSPPSSGLYGLCINANYADQNPPQREVSDIGAQWLRSIRYRNDFTPNHGNVSWLVVVNSEGIPRGASESWENYINRFAGEVKSIVQRNTWISAVEIWNEQDLPDGDHGPGYGRYLSPADYAPLLKATYLQVKSISNPPKVVVGGFGAGAGVGGQYLDEMKRQWGGSVYFDAVGFHPYLATVDGIGWPERGRMEDNINYLYARSMGKPLWLTEFGAAIQHLGGGKQEVARYLENCYLLFERLKDGNRRKVEVAFWFAWDDRTHWDPGRESHGLVELNRSGSPETWRRPAWYRYQGLTHR
jgi:hypothetical protein